MYNTRNIKDSAKIYSIIGVATTGGDYELVQNGMFGEIGEQIEDNIYELLPVSATAKDIFVVATPEVDPDESSIAKNSLYGFKLGLGQVADAVQVELHSKGEISEDMVDLGGKTPVKGGYLVLKAGQRKLAYQDTAPLEADNALLVAKVEDVLLAKTGIAVGLGSQNLIPNYKNIRFRVIETL